MLTAIALLLIVIALFYFKVIPFGMMALTDQDKSVIQNNINALKTTIKNCEESLRLDPKKRTHEDPKYYTGEIENCQEEINDLQNMLDHPEEHSLSPDSDQFFREFNTRLNDLADRVDALEKKSVPTTVPTT